MSWGYEKLQPTFDTKNTNLRRWENSAAVCQPGKKMEKVTHFQENESD